MDLSAARDQGWKRMSRHASAFWMLLASASLIFATPNRIMAQDSNAPSPSAGAINTPPSMVRTPSASPARNSGQLPRDANQEYVEYDLRPYTEHLKRVDKPEMAVVDWVLRATGDQNVWFSKPFGFMSADRSALSVYHTPAIHAGVKKLVDRFVHGPTDAQVLRLRLMTVANPNWRARALPLIQDFKSESPGIQAWLVTKEKRGGSHITTTPAHRHQTDPGRSPANI